MSRPPKMMEDRRRKRRRDVMAITGLTLGVLALVAGFFCGFRSSWFRRITDV
jgi:hypothetical protein